MLRQRARSVSAKREASVARRTKRASSMRRAKPSRARGGPKAARGAAKAVRDAESGLAAQLRELADRRAIEDGLICYVHALDTRDYARLRDCFAADARVKYGAAEWLTGVGAVAGYVAAILDPLDVTQHRLGSIAVELDSDRATSKAYLCAEHVRAGQRYTVGGHYLDGWERTPAGWRIAERRLEMTWTDGNPEVVRPRPA
jgi:hypothetical protein